MVKLYRQSTINCTEYCLIPVCDVSLNNSKLIVFLNDSLLLSKVFSRPNTVIARNTKVSFTLFLIDISNGHLPNLPSLLLQPGSIRTNRTPLLYDVKMLTGDPSPPLIAGVMHYLARVKRENTALIGHTRWHILYNYNVPESFSALSLWHLAFQHCGLERISYICEISHQLIISYLLDLLHNIFVNRLGYKSDQCFAMLQSKNCYTNN